MPVLVGSMTPTEIWTAAKAGAEYVKVFPASTLGPGYFRELRGPLRCRLTPALSYRLVDE